MPESKFCSWQDHEECDKREPGSERPNYCECDCHDPEGWVDATLLRWKLEPLAVSRGLVVKVWFRDHLGGQEWPWIIGVWSAAKMMGIDIPTGVNPLSFVKPAWVTNRLTDSKGYQIKLGGYRTSMHKDADTELRIQYVRVKKEESGMGVK